MCCVGGIFVTVAKHDVGFDSTAHQPRFSFAAFVGATSCYDPAKLLSLANLVADGVVKCPVENVFPFTQQGVLIILPFYMSDCIVFYVTGVTDIFKMAASGKSLGKQVLQIVQE